MGYQREYGLPRRTTKFEIMYCKNRTVAASSLLPPQAFSPLPPPPCCHWYLLVATSSSLSPLNCCLLIIATCLLLLQSSCGVARRDLGHHVLLYVASVREFHPENIIFFSLHSGNWAKPSVYRYPSQVKGTCHEETPKLMVCFGQLRPQLRPQIVSTSTDCVTSLTSILLFTDNIKNITMNVMLLILVFTPQPGQAISPVSTTIKKGILR